MLLLHDKDRVVIGPLEQREKTSGAILNAHREVDLEWRQAWFTKVSSRWAGSLRGGENKIGIQRDWSWYRQFTFMLDAVTVT